MRSLFVFLIFVAGGLVIFTACNKNINSKNTNNNGGTLEVRLTDGPGPYDAVNIDVEKVEVNISGDSGTPSGWQTLPLLHPGIYNLLDFRNGIDTVLTSADLPAGTLSQMRIVLGDNNSVVIDGQSYPLKTPLAQQSGLKFNTHVTLTGGILYRLWIDFDAGRSIVTTGNNTFLLKPVIRTYSDAIGGSIKGIVLPGAAKPEVFAIKGRDTLLALPDSVTGYYFLDGVSAGSWDLSLHALDSAYKDTSYMINVSTGVVTNAGSVTLSKK